MTWYTHRNYTDPDGTQVIEVNLRRWHPGYWLACLAERFGTDVVIDCTK